MEKDGELTYWIKDGTHRLLAAQAAGATKVDVVVTMVASKEEAMFAAMGVNTQHGKAAEVKDIELALETILESDQAAFYKKDNNPFAWDSQKLRAVLKCSPRKLEDAVVPTNNRMTAQRNDKIRKLWEQGKNNSEIARELGVPRKTVSNVVKDLNEGGQNPNDGKFATSEETSPTNGDTPTEVEDFMFDEGDDDEDDLASNVADIAASLERKNEAKVIKADATPEVDLEGVKDEFKMNFDCMTVEQQQEMVRFVLGLAK